MDYLAQENMNYLEQVKLLHRGSIIRFDYDVVKCKIYLKADSEILYVDEYCGDKTIQLHQHILLKRYLRYCEIIK